MSEEDHDPEAKKLGSNMWSCRSWITISVILVLIIIVILIPILALDPSSTTANEEKCYDECRIHLAETIPEGMSYPPNSPSHETTFSAWLNLIKSANKSITILSCFWFLRKNDGYPHKSSIKGEEIYQAIYNAGAKKGVKIKIVQSAPIDGISSTNTDFLEKNHAAEVRTVDFQRLFGTGLSHTKFWLIDDKHFYFGSPNMVWKSLAQLKELGLVGYNCSCLVKDMNKIFEVYWRLGAENAVIPSSWPQELQTSFNSNHPMSININGLNHTTFVSSSPPAINPLGRNEDASAISSVMHSAEKFIYISVMEYLPLVIYRPEIKFWPVIDNTIRAVALENRVKVRIVTSIREKTRPSEAYFLRSLAALRYSYPNVDIQIRRFMVPATEDQRKIPEARFTHTKYMVTDKSLYIGSSNWVGDYFIHTTGVGLIINEVDSNTNGTSSLRQQLQDVFERDWHSSFAKDIFAL